MKWRIVASGTSARIIAGVEVQVIVLEQDVRRCLVLFGLRDDGIGDGLVDGDVAAFPGFVDCAADVWGPRCVPHEVLDKPQERIAEDVVVALVDRWRDRHEANVDLVVGHLQKLSLGLRPRPRGRRRSSRTRSRLRGRSCAAARSAVTMPPPPRWALSEPSASAWYSMGPRLLAMMRRRLASISRVRASSRWSFASTLPSVGSS